MNFKHNC